MPKWSGYDYVHFEVQNPQKKAVQLYVEIRDQKTKDYWSRVNIYHLIQPGRHTISFPTTQYVGEKGARGRPLLKDQITHFIVSVGKNGPLIFDNFRLEKVDTSKVVFPGLKAIDFGPEDSPVMDGFTATIAIQQWQDKKLQERTPIIALTAHIMGAHKQQSKDIGMAAYLEKPVKLAEHEAVIQPYRG